MLRAAADKRKIDVRTNSRVTRINTNGSGCGHRRAGTRTSKRAVYQIEAKAVVVAAGGFSSNKEMVAKYCPKCTGMASSNQPGATGEGMLLAEQAGAELIHMDQVQIHPSLGANTNILVTEASRGAGAIMVNREAKRFVDELTTRDLASAAILEQTGKTVFLVFDGGIRKRLKTFEGLFHLGLGKEAPTSDELAKMLGIDPATFATTIANYNKYQQSKNDLEFKRNNMALPLTQAPFCSIEIWPGVHYTMGGISINGKAQALAKGGKPIPGLYAAGEVTGGVHGANRLGGNSTIETVVFGRIAGREAAQYRDGRRHGLDGQCADGSMRRRDFERRRSSESRRRAMKSEHKVKDVGRREFLRTLGVGTSGSGDKRAVRRAQHVPTPRAEDERRRARYQPNSPLGAEILSPSIAIPTSK